jgi:hypothetical protein
VGSRSQALSTWPSVWIQSLSGVGAEPPLRWWTQIPFSTGQATVPTCRSHAAQHFAPEVASARWDPSSEARTAKNLLRVKWGKKVCPKVWPFTGFSLVPDAFFYRSQPKAWLRTKSRKKVVIRVCLLVFFACHVPWRKCVTVGYRLPHVDSLWVWKTMQSVLTRISVDTQVAYKKRKYDRTKWTEWCIEVSFRCHLGHRATGCSRRVVLVFFEPLVVLCLKKRFPKRQPKMSK